VRESGATLHKLEITDAVKSDRINQLLAYWEQVCRGRPMPAKRDVDPSDLKPLLPYLMIAEIHHEPLRVRYRLVGTEAVRMAREDYTGRWLGEVGWVAAEVASYIEQYAMIVATRRPLLGTGHLVSDDGKERIFEWGKFPLSDDGARVTHCVGIEDLIPVRPMTPMRTPSRR
jgi:hypothetical protein